MAPKFAMEVPADEPEAVKLNGARYVGAGAYVIGVPARDMSADEWAALPPAKQDALIAQGIMEVR